VRERAGVRPRPGLTAAAVAVALTAASGLAAADLEDLLRARWNGVWVVTKVETYSDCDGLYDNDDVTGNRVTSKADLAFAAGELAHVDKVSLKRSRVDAYLTVAEPLRIAHQDGPFTLYEAKTCKIQLLIDAAAKDIREGRVEPLDEAIAAVLSRFDTRAAAQASPEWNQRALEPLPADYADTLARHEAWKVERVNSRLATVREDALAEAARAVEHMDDDPPYLEGFARGVEEVRHWTPGSCESLASASFASFERREPKEHRGDGGPQRAWRRGWHDGQALAWNLAVARAVRDCFLPPPPAPPAS
jgi:hypothetical protein